MPPTGTLGKVLAPVVLARDPRSDLARRLGHALLRWYLLGGMIRGELEGTKVSAAHELQEERASTMHG
jgi:hypothetical protein